MELLRVIFEDIFGLPSGSGGQAGVPGPAAPDCQWALSQNTPNPWTGRTEIAYEVAAPSRVSIRVYDVGGRLVRTLVDEHLEPGRYSVAWDGTAGTGAPVASGVYFYKMEGAGFKATRKIVVVK